MLNLHMFWGPLWSWSYGSWIYNYLCNQCLSPLKLWVWTPLKRVVLNTTLCGKVCKKFTTGRWFFPAFPVSFTNKTDRHDITEILLKVALNPLNQTKPNVLYFSVFRLVNYYCFFWLFPQIIKTKFHKLVLHTKLEVYSTFLFYFDFVQTQKNICPCPWSMMSRSWDIHSQQTYVH